MIASLYQSASLVNGKLFLLGQFHYVSEWRGVSSARVKDHTYRRRKPRMPTIKFGTPDGRGLWTFIPRDVEDSIRANKGTKTRNRIPHSLRGYSGNSIQSSCFLSRSCSSARTFPSQ